MFDTTFSYTVYAIGFQPSQEEVEKFKQDALATGMWYEGDDGYLYPKDTAADKLRKFVEHGITVPKLAGEGAIKIAEVLSSFFGNADNYQKNVKTDGQYVYFDNDFTNNINIALQDKVHALDGYYLIEPVHPMSDFSPAQYAKEVYNICKEKKIDLRGSYENIISEQSINKIKTVVDKSCALYVHYDFASKYDLNFMGISSNYSLGADNYIYLRSDGKTYITDSYKSLNVDGYVDQFSAYFDWNFNTYYLTLEDLKKFSYGDPFRVFLLLSRPPKFFK